MRIGSGAAQALFGGRWLVSFQVIKCNVYCVPARPTSQPSTPFMTDISRKTRHRASSCSFIHGRGRSTLNWIASRRCNAVVLQSTPHQPNGRYGSLADDFVYLYRYPLPPKADINRSFDHLVRTDNKRLWYREAECLGGLEVNGQVVRGWSHHWQVRWTRAVQDLADVGPRLTTCH
jgi:hypothetical protein